MKYRYIPSVESTGFNHNFWLAYSKKHSRKNAGILERFWAYLGGLFR